MQLLQGVPILLKTVKAEDKVSVSYSTHVQKLGWQSSVTDNVMAGTSGRLLRLEAINIKVVTKGEAAPVKTNNAFVQVLTSENCTHSWDSDKAIKVSTCVNTGIMRYTCSKCKTTKEEVIPATGHKYEWVVAEEATKLLLD